MDRKDFDFDFDFEKEYGFDPKTLEGPEFDGEFSDEQLGFDLNDPTKYTRHWFSWPNALFCELMLDYCGIRVKK